MVGNLSVMSIISIYFVYGLAFFSMGLFILVQTRRFSRLTLANSIIWLGLFGLTHGLAEWGTVFTSIHQLNGASEDFIQLQRAIEVLLIAVSYIFLLYFAVNLYVDTRKAPEWLRVLPIGLFLFWLLNYLLFPLVLPDQDPVWWFRAGETWARYLLALPGSILGGIVLLLQKREWDPLHLPRLNTFRLGAAAALFFYGLVGGLVVPSAPFFPASIINTKTFHSVFHLPVPFFRALAGLVLAYCTFRLLGLFDLEFQRRLDEAEKKQTLAAERERIGQNLHDGVIQGIYGTGLELENIRYLIDEDPQAAKENLNSVMHRLNGLINEIRLYILDLRLPRVAGRTLHDILQEKVAAYRRVAPVDIDLQVKGQEPPGLADEWKENLILIIKEGLTNILRHAGATHVVLELVFSGGEARLTIRDNGIGISPASTPGFGLTSMQERSMRLQGSLQIAPHPEGGTQVTGVFPLPPLPPTSSRKERTHDSRAAGR